MNLQAYTFKLDNNRTAPIHVLTHKGREVWIAQEVGAALGYEEARFFTSKINGEWADRFRAEKDTYKVEGEELVALRQFVCGDSPHANFAEPELAPANEPAIISPMARSLLLLTESGVFLACALAKTEAGDRFRWWLADEVLPSIRRTGSYEAPNTKPRKELLGVAIKALQILRSEGAITKRHHHEQLTRITSSITGLEVEMAPYCAEPQEGAQWDAFFCAWFEAVGFGGVETRYLYALCLERGLMAAVLGEGVNESRKIRLAKALVQQAKDGIVERRGTNKRNHNQIWRLPRTFTPRFRLDS